MKLTLLIFIYNYCITTWVERGHSLNQEDQRVMFKNWVQENRSINVLIHQFLKDLEHYDKKDVLINFVQKYILMEEYNLLRLL